MKLADQWGLAMETRDASSDYLEGEEDLSWLRHQRLAF